MPLSANPGLNILIARTIVEFWEAPSASDTEIHRRLVNSGADHTVAARMVEFVPIAYGRLLLESLGIRFPESYRRKLPNGDLSEERKLSSEPLWRPVIEFAETEVKRGISRADLLTVAGRSSEFDAANRLLNRGSRPHDLVFGPVIFSWLEKGP